MKRKSIWNFIACLVFLPVPVLAGDLTSADGYRDLRILNEFGLVDFSEIDAPGEDWAVVRVLQGPRVPDEEIPTGPSDQARKGSVICDLLNASGTPVAILRGTVPDGQWPCWAPVPARVLFGTVPAFMKDRDTGLYLCRVNRNFPKVDRIVLEESSLIPETWAGKVKPAFETWRANRDTFTQPVEGKRREKLIELSKDANPVTSFLAYKRLLETGHLYFADVPDELLEARSQLGVVVLLHVLHWTPQAEQDHLFQRLAKTVDSAKSLESLHGIATACGMELYMRRKARPDERASFNLLSRIDKRIKEQTTAGKPDEYFDAAEEEWARKKGMLAK